MASPELAVLYAVLVLHDDGIPLSGEQINELLSVGDASFKQRGLFRICPSKLPLKVSRLK
jgi:hypothetical protein